MTTHYAKAVGIMLLIVLMHGVLFGTYDAQFRADAGQAVRTK